MKATGERRHRGLLIVAAAAAVVVLLVWMVLTRTQGSAAPTEDPKTLALALIGQRHADDFAFLADWSEPQLQRLITWLTLGIRFRGDWTSDELTTAMDVLNAYGDAYGDARFAEIALKAVKAGGWGKYLTLVRRSGMELPAAVWYDRSGRIYFNDGLFDAQFVYENYSWSFLRGEYVEPAPEVTIQHVVIGHEFGHVMIDGMHAEAAAHGADDFSWEAEYTNWVPGEQWPHTYTNSNENLATELSVWALKVDRTPEVADFRTNMLEVAAEGADWPQMLRGSETVLVDAVAP
jgi:hypothetical protein